MRLPFFMVFHKSVIYIELALPSAPALFSAASRKRVIYFAPGLQGAAPFLRIFAKAQYILRLHWQVRPQFFCGRFQCFLRGVLQCIVTAFCRVLYRVYFNAQRGVLQLAFLYLGAVNFSPQTKNQKIFKCFRRVLLFYLICRSTILKILLINSGRV